MSETNPTPPPAIETPIALPDAKWSCQALRLDENAQAQGALSEALTVGQKFVLQCEGSPVALAKEKLRLSLPKDNPYALRILQTQSLTETSASFVATSWVVGPSRVRDVVLTDGEKRIELSGFSFEVKSVITPENNPEGKPYPPAGPLSIHLPLFIWVVLSLAVLLAAFLTIKAVRRSMQRKRLLKELGRHGTALSPFNQFAKDLRGLARKFPHAGSGAKAWSLEDSKQYLSDLNSYFRWFLARELLIPTLEFSDSRILKEFKKRYPAIFKAVAKDLRLALGELEKALKTKEAVAGEDAQQITELCRKLAERVVRLRSE